MSLFEDGVHKNSNRLSSVFLDSPSFGQNWANIFFWWRLSHEFSERSQADEEETNWVVTILTHYSNHLLNCEGSAKSVGKYWDYSMFLCPSAPPWLCHQSLLHPAVGALSCWEYVSWRFEATYSWRAWPWNLFQFEHLWHSQLESYRN